ncbi:acyl-CoA thioester hydrolase [Mesobacillus persicus]|uniref:Acyl-CoA thioester hydrolase n=1 Tax=Mesobacillus persicus TaxID=930146 RepID=A0A1H8G1X5_9BACI|nr:acyl-CoA thioester hydrolase [Mesobacillus persicus]
MFHYQDEVRGEWVDYNGHMNDAAYANVFSLAVDSFMDYIGLDENAREKYAYTIFTLETHIVYLQEAHKGEPLSVTVQLLDVDAKRLHVFFTMKNKAENVIATSEQMLMGMDSAQGKSAPFPGEIAPKIEEIWNAHQQLETPKLAGRKIGIKRS